MFVSFHCGPLSSGVEKSDITITRFGMVGGGHGALAFSSHRVTNWFDSKLLVHRALRVYY